MRAFLALLLLAAGLPAAAYDFDSPPQESIPIGAGPAEGEAPAPGETYDAQPPAQGQEEDGAYLMTGPLPPPEDQYSDNDRRAKAIFDAINAGRPVPAAELDWARNDLRTLAQAVQSPEYEAQGLRHFQKTGQSVVPVQFPDGSIQRMNARQFVAAQRQLILQQITRALQILDSAKVR